MTVTMRRSIFLSLALFLFLISPFAAGAYSMTEQEADTLEGGSALFTLEYAFGLERHELLMPFNSAFKNADRPLSLVYDVLDENGDPVSGTATGIVLASAPFKGSGYEVQKGIAEKFTLIVVFTPDAESLGHRYRLVVRQLPFYFDDVLGGLNPSELQYYRTELTPTR